MPTVISSITHLAMKANAEAYMTPLLALVERKSCLLLSIPENKPKVWEDGTTKTITTQKHLPAYCYLPGNRLYLP